MAAATTYGPERPAAYGETNHHIRPIQTLLLHGCGSLVEGYSDRILNQFHGVQRVIEDVLGDVVDDSLHHRPGIDERDIGS